MYEIYNGPRSRVVMLILYHTILVHTGLGDMKSIEG